jgi:hypothetical protein
VLGVAAALIPSSARSIFPGAVTYGNAAIAMPRWVGCFSFGFAAKKATVVCELPTVVPTMTGQ